MDPIQFHRQSLAVAQSVVDGLDSAHYDLPTPCDAWNVRQVLEHMIGGNRRIAGDPPAEGEDVIGSDLSAAYAASAEAASATFEADGGLDRIYKLLIGEIPGHSAIRARASDQLAHAWDLSRALGAPTDRAPELYEHGLELLRQRFEAGRNAALFADEQPAPADASAADRFAAYAGRRV